MMELLIVSSARRHLRRLDALGVSGRHSPTSEVALLLIFVLYLSVAYGAVANS